MLCSVLSCVTPDLIGGPWTYLSAMDSRVRGNDGVLAVQIQPGQSPAVAYTTGDGTSVASTADFAPPEYTAKYQAGLIR